MKAVFPAVMTMAACEGAAKPASADTKKAEVTMRRESAFMWDPFDWTQAIKRWGGYARTFRSALRGWRGKLGDFGLLLRS
jgi:hypothetical protein